MTRGWKTRTHWSLWFAGLVGAVACTNVVPQRSGEPVRARHLVLGVTTPGGSSGRADTTPTFARDVAPILYENCVTCHNPDGQAPFSLLRYEEVEPLAGRIRDVTAQRRMPPWQPEVGAVTFVGERRLTRQEIATIRRWVEAGAPEGDTAAMPDPPQLDDGWYLGTPDLVVDMPKPFTVPGNGEDLFRNFVIPIPTERGRWVSAVEFRPRTPGTVHHATILLDTTSHSRQLAARDSAPGFPGIHAGGRARPPRGFVLGWTPGATPYLEPGLSWRLEPGTDLVLQLHTRPRDTPASIDASIGFHFTDEAPERRPVMLRLASETIDIPAGTADYVVEDRYELPVPVRVLGLHPHAHYLARDMDVWADLPNGTRRPLLEIRSWNFDWQNFYRLEEPLVLPRGTALHMRYSYDNTADNPRNPNDPPHRVVYGPTAADEMGDLWIQVMPVDGAEAPVLERDFARKDLATRIAGWRQALRVRPDDARAHHGLGTVFFQRGRLDEAVSHLRAAVEADPHHPHAHYHLGLALQARGDLEGAIASYRDASSVDPSRADIYFSHALALTASGRPEEGMEVFRQGIRRDPGNARARVAMAWSLLTPEDDSLRRLKLATQLARDAMTQSPEPNPSARAVLASAYAVGGDFEGSIREAEVAVSEALEAGDVRLLLILQQHLEAYRTGRLPEFRPSH